MSRLKDNRRVTYTRYNIHVVVGGERGSAFTMATRKYQRMECEHYSCTLSKSSWYDHYDKFHGRKKKKPPSDDESSGDEDRPDNSSESESESPSTSHQHNTTGYMVFPLFNVS